MIKKKKDFRRKRVYRKMWVSREIEIPNWEEVPSLRERNNIYYIEYYIDAWSPARERNLEKVWRFEGLVSNYLYLEEGYDVDFSANLRKCHCLMGGGYDFCERYVYLPLFFFFFFSFLSEIQISNLLFDTCLS